MNIKRFVRVAVALSACCLVAVDVFARGGGGGGGRGGGGGGRGGGGMGHVGGGGGRPAGGGARPSMGGGGARPSRPSPSRPANVSRPANRPSTANISKPNISRPATRPATRPGTPNISRPSTRPAGGGGPSLGNLHPSGGRPTTRPARPEISRPSTGGAIAQRPSIRPPGDLKPAIRPGAGDLGLNNRPGPNRPVIDPPAPNRPGINRPGTGNRPDIGRPGQGGGGIQRPKPDRPSIGDITRPGQDGGGIQRPRPDRPDIGPDRPGFGPDRPGIRPDRPIIGGGNNNNINRPIHIGDTNIGNNVGIGNNIGNRPVIGNRPINNWGVRPGGDYWSQNHNWADHWHDTIHDHHDWYHGCWNGHGGSNWYAPVVWGSVGWGLGSMWGNSWGYGQTYTNPYYDTAAVAAPVYDYSQPVVVNNYPTSYAGADATSEATAPPPQEPPENAAALKQFDEALASFKQGQYEQALSGIEAALRSLPKDPVLHETRALCLFAVGRYQEAAATLNSLLASAPGMDWTSMSSLYGNADDYTAQLRKLEAHIKSKPDDAPAAFVLAYHYLVLGENDSAIKALQKVVELQPKDATARRMLAALAPPEPETKPAETPAPEAAPDDGPSTDLVGKWLAKSADANIELTITEDSQFTWHATPKGKAAIDIKGNIAASSDELVLETKDQGNMAGKVKSEGADKFTFTMLGTPPGDGGLEFQRQ